jgi:hypothetical protein
MNLNRLYEILNETTIQLRKGEVIHGDKPLVDAIKAGVESDKLPGGVVTFDMMPTVAEAADGLEKVDLEFLVIGVHKAKAEQHRAELIGLLNTYPNPDSLASGPSYITVGGEIGDQGAAFQLFALGKVLGLWEVITPGSFGMTGAEAQQAAGSGFIMMTGYKQAA